MDSVLENLQECAYERLRSHRDLAGLEVVNYRSSDLASALRVYGREPLGICAVVLPPLPLRFRGGSPQPCDVCVELQVRVVEDIGTNRGSRRALEVAECVHRILSGTGLAAGDLGYGLVPAGERPWTITENFPESTRLEIELRFLAQAFLQPNGGEES
ncbi:MAG: hypothetical protein LBB14_03970 [Puniceicoccales bacterium]|jgi:hypothetical protein|nr:hypothetical protein [Puniceicoccales bacterium]